MDKEKVYILQKDAPDLKLGSDFKWSEKQDRYYFYDKIRNLEFYYLKEVVENNPEWFKLKEEVKPVVVGSEFWINKIRFVFSGGFPEISITKERLAEILINEDRGLLCFVTVALEEDIKKYTEKEHIQALEDCWNAAREKDRLREPDLIYHPDKYKSFSDYMSSKQKQ